MIGVRVVHKYPLYGGVVQNVKMPAGAQIVHVAAQDDVPCLWAHHAAFRPEGEADVDRRFRIVGTGHPEIQPGSTYVGTVHVYGGTIVLHVFEEPHHTHQPDPTNPEGVSPA